MADAETLAGDGRTTIPYNADAVTSGQILETGPPARYRLPYVTVRRGAPLRLNSGQIEFGDPPPLRDLATVPDQLRFLSRHFQHQCGVWAKYARRFVESYFAFVETEVAENRAELRDRLSRFGTLYTPDQWTFSALRPLPRAHLVAPADAGGLPDSLVRVDIAFWTEAGAVAIELVGRDTPVAATERRRDRLARAGVRLVAVSHDALDSGGARALADRLPADFRRFWRGQALPAGPFKHEAGLGTGLPG